MSFHGHKAYLNAAYLVMFNCMQCSVPFCFLGIYGIDMMLRFLVYFVLTAMVSGEVWLLVPFL